MLKINEITLNSDLRELNKLESFVEEISDVYNVNSSYYSNMLVVLNEAVTNSIVHGNKEHQQKKVKILFEAKNKGLYFTVSDEGTGFDFDAYPDPTDMASDTHENIGRGLYLMKVLSDTIEYDKEKAAIIFGFKISSINKELAVSRIDSLQAYFSSAKKPIEV
jgi:serine/threonine-protein kinase RsbW